MFLAPNVNSYKRYAAGSWAPTTLAWGYDNRTCGFRVVGTARARASRPGSPGPTSTPTSRSRRCSQRGCTGSSRGSSRRAVFEGNAYESDVARFPSTLREAIAELENGTIARPAFGDEVVDHYLNYAQTEQRLFDQVVTCYERERLFERG